MDLLKRLTAINFKRNPYPAGFGMNYRSEDLFIRNPDGLANPTSGNPVDVFKKIFSKK